jgi:glycosyltransferase involved in cell wall biosynthesis
MARTDDGRGASSDGDGIALSVVMPAYNEVESISELVGETLEVLEDGWSDGAYEILVVDDGSTDGTLGELRRLADEHPAFRAVELRRNFGQSAALAAGIDEARGRVIVTMDADGQNDPADIPRLLDRIEEGYDCVSGWRRDRRDPASKRIPSRIQTALARLTGPDISDFGCTLKAYRAEALRDIDLYGEGHRYIPAMLYNRGYDITEIPVNHRRRLGGETKYGPTRLIKGSVDLLFHIFWNRFSTRPLHLLGGLGTVMFGAGFLIGAHAVFVKYVYGAALLQRLPRLMLTVALVVFGLQLLMFGVLAEMIAKLHYTDQRPYRIAEVYGDE